MTSRIRNFTWAFGFGTALVLPLALSAQTPADAPPDPAQAKYTNAVAAVVNDKVITLTQLKKQMDPLVAGIFQEVGLQYPDDPAGAKKEFQRRLQTLEKELLHSMADRILIIQEFHKKGITIAQAYLDRRFDDVITKNWGGDHEAFLRDMQAKNMTEREFRQQLEDDDIVDYMTSQLSSSVTGISPDRIKDYYDKNQKQFVQEEAVKLRQITLKPVAGTPPELLQQQADYIEQQARQPNADFAELARKNSQDEYAKNGGVAGWFPRNKLQTDLETATFKLGPGEISNPVAVGGNIYIFKCDDKRASGVQPLEKVRAEIETILKVQDTRLAQEKWLQKLRGGAYVKYNIGSDS